MARPTVALLGNMNNNHFATARYLRDRGVDAHVLLFDHEMPHFLPASDTYIEADLDFVRTLTWGSVPRYISTPARKMREDIAPYDVLIGHGLAPAYCHKAGRRLDIFAPFGGDIWAMLGRAEGNPLRFVKYLPTMSAQAKGIRASRVFHMAPTNELYEAQWERFRGGPQRWYEGLPVVYDGAYRPDRMALMMERSPAAPGFQRVRESADIMLFLAARHFWKCDPRHPAAKGTHRLIHGIAIFRRRHPDVKIALATLEYGQQVAESKALVRELGLEENVVWFPPMARKDLMVGLGLADIACAEFENSWTTSGVIYEALAMSKPILAYRDDSLYSGQRELYGILNAKEPEDIADRIEAYWRAPEKYRVLGSAGREWYLTNVVNAPLDKYCALIRTVSQLER